MPARKGPNMTTYTTRWGSDTVSIRADWAQASAPVERLTGDGWEATGRQVADHAGPIPALRAEVEAMALADGRNYADAEADIVEAMRCCWSE